MYNDKTWSGWFWNKCYYATKWFCGPDNSTACEKTSHATKRVVMDIRREFIEYVIGLIGKGNLDVAAINFTGIGFFNKWLKSDPKLRTPSSQTAFSLILLLTGVRFFQKLSGDLLQQAQQKHKEEQLTFWWKWIGKLSSLTQFTTNTITGLLYEFSTIAVIGLLFEPAFDWFGLLQKYFSTAESITIGAGIGKALFYLLDFLPDDWNDFCKTWKSFDVKMLKFTNEGKNKILTAYETAKKIKLNKNEQNKLFDQLENLYIEFAIDRLNQRGEERPFVINEV
jgi:hypothetical protein